MNDRQTIQSLAAEYAEKAHSSENQEVRDRYADLNALRLVQPVILIDEVPWSELASLPEMQNQTTDPFAREIETYFRRKLVQYKYFRGDLYLEPYYPLKRPVHVESWGIETEEDIVVTDAANKIVSHRYHDQLKDEDDLARLHTPTVNLDAQRESELQQRAWELLGDCLAVKLVGHAVGFNPWDTIARWRGVQNLLIDLLDRPEFCHRIMESLTRIHLDIVDQFEKMNLLEPNAPLVHCTAGFADELDPIEGCTTRANVWARGAAQIFGDVSREMLDEFDLAYQKRYMEGFGLAYYGCCEPLDTKIDLVEKLPGLRKISITPWADVDIAAECMAGKYVLSRKPNPAHVAISVDEELVRTEIRATLEACRKNNLVCEFVLKDISTIGHKLENLVSWEGTARRTIEDFG